VELELKHKLHNGITIKQISKLNIRDIQFSYSELYNDSIFLNNLNNLITRDFRDEAVLNLQYIKLITSTENSKIQVTNNIHSMLLNPNNNIFFSILGIICAISISSGIFTKKQFLQSTKYHYKGKPTYWIYYKYLYLYYLYKLTKVGFVAKTYLGTIFFVFHSTSAKFYKNKYKNNTKFKDSFNSALAYESKKMSADDYLAKWKNEVERIGFSFPLKNNFELAVLDSDYKELLETIDRVSEDNTNYFLYEQSLLNEKIGKLPKAKQLLSKYIKENNNYEQLKINLVEIEHDTLDKAYIPILKSLENSNNLLIKIQVVYWQEHIKMHNGLFSSNVPKYSKLLEDLNNINFNTLKESEQYYYRNILRRIYFDAFRSYYLAGYLDCSKNSQYHKLVTILSSENEKILRYNSREFEGYENKFIKAHYLHYDVAFEYYIFNKPLDECNIVFGIEMPENPSRYYLADIALEFYEKAKEKFLLSNDKTNKYIDLRIQELNIAKTTLNISDTHNNYQIIVQAKEHYEDYLNNYAKRNNFKEFEAYSYEYIAKCDYLLSSPYLENNHSQTRIDYIIEITNNLTKSKEIYSKLKNIYGEFRCKFLSCLLVSKNNDKILIQDLLIEAEKNNFLREKRVLYHIKDNHLSPFEWEKIVAFYPLVLQ
jgi:hypothetical protein